MSILNKLTLKHLLLNKKRTVVTIIGVILSCALMVGIGLLFSTIRNYAINEVTATRGSHHLSVHNFSSNKLHVLDNHANIKDYGMYKGLGFSKLEQGDNLYKPYLYLVSANEKLLSGLNLVDGRLPTNNNEVVISSHIRSNGGVIIEVGEKLELEIGNRYYDDELIVGNQQSATIEKPDAEEDLRIIGNRELTVVGIIDRTHLEDYNSAGYMIFTTADEILDEELITAYIEYKSPKDIYDQGSSLADILGVSKQEVKFNDSLLSLYGVSKYNNITGAMSGIIIIILSLVGAGCTIVIYNSFAISVMERKKQFGLFSSIGATRKQIRTTVFFEAIIISVIGIPLGILSGFIGIYVVIDIVSHLLSSAFPLGLTMSAYPLFIYIPVIFMIIVIFASAFIPSYRASRITPIDAIRLTHDIKIKSKKIRSNNLIRRLFGIESEIAYKNIQRNKSKYRITVIALVISIVMFISFSSFSTYIEKSSSSFEGEPFDIRIGLSSSSDSSVNQTIHELRSHPDTKELVGLKSFWLPMTLPNVIFDKNFINHMNLFEEDLNQDEISSDYITGLQIINLDDISYRQLMKELKLDGPQRILINNIRSVYYGSNERYAYDGKIIEVNPNLELDICYYPNLEDLDPESDDIKDLSTKVGCYYKLQNMVASDVAPWGLHFYDVSIILPDSEYEELRNLTAEVAQSDYNSIYINVNDYQNIDKKIEEVVIDNRDFENQYYVNYLQEEALEKNMILALKILTYGFTSLVTLIGVTSVFNTINSSIALRKVEFSVLRSTGLSPKGFNKIIRFETLILGLKAIIYSIPLSLAVIYLFHLQFNDVVSIGSDLLIPWNSVLVVLLGIFIIMYITMKYSTNKLNKANIIDAIREENI